MSRLFSPFRLRDLNFKNRIFVSPMCQYSSRDGFPTDWHLVHLGARAVGGAALVMAEATAVTPIGRISPADAGIWSDEQAKAYQRITSFIREQGAVPAVQLAHAGRKASTREPWSGGGPVTDGTIKWIPIGPSALPYDSGWPTPREMSGDDIANCVDDFAAAARRARVGGFDVVEIHMAHGYLLHEFLSPLSNARKDDFGGSLENRMRFPLMVAEKVREAWPSELPVFVRISASDWVEGGWDLEQTVSLVKELEKFGIDLIDCSSGGNVPNAKIPVGPGYQVQFAEVIRKQTGIATGAVGLITDSRQAEEIVASDRADVVFLARELLRDPHWPLRAASELGADVAWPQQYDRARPHRPKS